MNGVVALEVVQPQFGQLEHVGRGHRRVPQPGLGRAAAGVASLEAGVAARVVEKILLLVVGRDGIAVAELGVLDVRHRKTGERPPVAALGLDAETLGRVAFVQQLDAGRCRAARDDDALEVIGDRLDRQPVRRMEARTFEDGARRAGDFPDVRVGDFWHGSVRFCVGVQLLAVLTMPACKVKRAGALPGCKGGTHPAPAL